MEFSALFCVLNAKYIHSSPAPWCLLAGVKQYAPHINAQVLEATINEKEDDVLARILSKAPTVVTFTCYIWNITETLRLTKRIKNELPSIIIALGGPEVSYNAAEMLATNNEIDYILSGEGEESVPAFLSCLEKSEAPTPQIVSGLCTREKISEPCVLDGEVPSPYTPEYLAALGGRIAYLETSRGCPYSCAFCLSGRCGKPRYFSLEKSFENILLLSNSGTQTVKFIDRTFNANPAHANAILQFILGNYGTKIPAGVCFHFELAGDILREETFKLLQKAPVGAFQLEIGMQSFCEKTLAAVRRKTDTTVLKKNIQRLVAMQNMHVHIDLIAGLPYENIATFAQSFNTAYALGANMLQLGFLKLLYGSAMRDEPQEFPCEFSLTPPYEVTSTPWLAPKDIAILRSTEDALERIYNSGRFRETAAYMLAKTRLTPFDFYTQIGGVPAKTPLDEYAQILYEKCVNMPNVEKDFLRDAMVCDMLSINSTGKLPKCLQVKDDMLRKAVIALSQNPETAPKKGIKRGTALLYGAKCAVFVDYTQKNAVTGRYLLHKCAIDNLPRK